MQVRVLLFAAARQRAGKSEIIVELPADASASAAKNKVLEACPALVPLADHLRIAVNQAFVDGATRLSPGDEVALLPPVSGGVGVHAFVRDEPLSLERVVAAVSGVEHGAVATFTGMVRRTSRGHVVTRLDYEAYVPMAERVMREVIDEIVVRHPSVKLAIEHRIGELALGALAVVIAAGAPHRREALAACDEAIESVKARAPIWKREHTDQGAAWVGCDGCVPGNAIWKQL